MKSAKYLVRGLHFVALIGNGLASSTFVKPRGGARPNDIQASSKSTVGKDPCIAASPLVIGAVSSEGVVLIALHTSFASEPLLFDADEMLNGDNENATTDIDPNGTNETPIEPIGDVPMSYRGPFRIYAVDGFGTGLICAGWRAHGQLIADYCRRLAKEEFDVFGPPSGLSTKEYGRYLASETSLWMAYNAVSNGQKLSCVGLLASSGDKATQESPCCLWLFDATGAYRVKAHAIGGGPLAGIVNEQLDNMELESIGAEEALRQILKFLNSQELPSNTRAEFAIVGGDKADRKSLKRVFSSNLFGVKT